MSVRSGRIHGPADLTTVATKLFTVPAGRTLVVRSVSLSNHSAAAVNPRLFINGSAAGNEWHRSVTLPANTTLHLDGWWALGPADEVWGIASVTNVCATSFFGALLLGDEPDLPL